MNNRTRWDALLERDWADDWDSLPDAPEWEPRAKTAQITLRLPGALLARIRRVAARRSLPYHALARSWIANGLHESEPPPPSATPASGEPLSEQLNIKLEQTLLDALKARAHEHRYPYHRLAREWIETALTHEEQDLGFGRLAAKPPALHRRAAP